MKFSITKAAVLGAGVMGAGIAAPLGRRRDSRAASGCGASRFD